MCNVDVEHLMHTFLDCSYARSCWQVVDMHFNWSQIFSANEWLLDILEVSLVDEVVKICTALYGIWLARNKKVWEDLDLPDSIAMNIVFQIVQEWSNARVSKQKGVFSHPAGGNCGDRKWIPPIQGSYKVNVDASWYPEADMFSVGMVLRDCCGTFVEGRSMVLPKSANPFEAECIGMREALSWVKSWEEKDVMMESDSKLTTDAISGEHEYVLEVGHIIDQCKLLLHSLP
ncbi:uncharacterized protein LOC141666398 [Apium graveolens]|uniref:uncharacterized protein LOC141666398 n=1 Tax=Apium graveolens TaxID=4045 RepID=UPI003D7B46C1